MSTVFWFSVYNVFWFSLSTALCTDKTDNDIMKVMSTEKNDDEDIRGWMEVWGSQGTSSAGVLEAMSNATLLLRTWGSRNPSRLGACTIRTGTGYVQYRLGACKIRTGTGYLQYSVYSTCQWPEQSNQLQDMFSTVHTVQAMRLHNPNRYRICSCSTGQKYAQFEQLYDHAHQKKMIHLKECPNLSSLLNSLPTCIRYVQVALAAQKSIVLGLNGACSTIIEHVPYTTLQYRKKYSMAYNTVQYSIQNNTAYRTVQQYGIKHSKVNSTVQHTKWLSIQYSTPNGSDQESVESDQYKRMSL